MLGVVDGQRTDNAVIERRTGIGVEGKRKVHRNVQARFIGITIGTAHQPIDPQAAIAIIVGIIVARAREVVNAVGHTGPLHPITRCFAETGVSAHLGLLRCDERNLFLTVLIDISADITHSATYFHGVGGDHKAFLGRQVA